MRHMIIGYLTPINMVYVFLSNIIIARNYNAALNKCHF